jgi:GxxExxY protein
MRGSLPPEGAPLKKEEMHVECEISLPIICDKIRIDAGYRTDIAAGGSIIIENKTVEKVLPIPEVQLLTLSQDEGQQIGFFTQLECSPSERWIKRMVNYF